MFRPRETTQMSGTHRDEYVVDPLAVADAILRRLSSGWPSKVFESVQAGMDGAVGADEGKSATGPDLA